MSKNIQVSLIGLMQEKAGVVILTTTRQVVRLTKRLLYPLRRLALQRRVALQQARSPARRFLRFQDDSKPSNALLPYGRPLSAVQSRVSMRRCSVKSRSHGQGNTRRHRRRRELRCPRRGIRRRAPRIQTSFQGTRPHQGFHSCDSPCSAERIVSQIDTCIKLFVTQA